MRVDRTEVIRDNANPIFQDKFIVIYDFKKDNNFKFRVYDVDDFQNVDDLDEQDFIGEAIVSLHEIVSVHDGTLDKQLIN